MIGAVPCYSDFSRFLCFVTYLSWVVGLANFLLSGLCYGRSSSIALLHLRV